MNIKTRLEKLEKMRLVKIRPFPLCYFYGKTDYPTDERIPTRADFYKLQKR